MKKILIIVKNDLYHRIRTIISYYNYFNKQGKAILIVIWQKDNNCPTSFSDHFKPLPNVETYETIPKRHTKVKPYLKGDGFHKTFLNFKNPYGCLEPIDDHKKIIFIHINLLRHNGKQYIALRINPEDNIGKYKKFINSHYNEYINIYVSGDESHREELLDVWADAIPVPMEDLCVDIYLCCFAQHFLGNDDIVSKTIEIFRKDSQYHSQKSIML